MSLRRGPWARAALVLGLLSLAALPAPAPAQQTSTQEEPAESAMPGEGLPASGVDSLDLPSQVAPEGALPPAEARPLEPLPILVVDMQQVRRASTAVDAVQRQIEGRRAAYEARLRETERDLQQDQQSLLERRTEMSGEDYAQAVRALEERLTRAQREMRETKASLDRLYNRGMLEIDRTVVTIAEELAVERGAQMVLPKAAVLLVRNELEVTEAVVGRLNARLPTLDLEALIPRP